ncbi:MAG: type II toxin-antitoxin system RelE family toxin [Candidatus Sumerlaeia bacterium]
MAWNVEILPKVMKALAKIPLRDRRRIFSRIEGLQKEARPEGVKKLKARGDREFYRIRSGDYRIIYRIEEKRLLVLVVRVAYRKEVYR